MLHENWLVLWHAQSGTLGMGGFDELGGRDISGRNPLLFQGDDIVRTARDAGPSIAEGFDDRVALLAQFCFERLGRCARHGRLHAA